MSPNNLICLLDFENLIRAQNDSTTKRIMQRLSALLRERGRVIAARAYADWRQFGKDANVVEDVGFELVHASQRQNGKNSADIRLVLDAIDFVHTGHSLAELVIVSGDSDMIPLIQRVRAHGVRVTVVTDRQSASGRLSAYADEIVYIEALQGSAPEKNDIAQAERLLVRALQQADTPHCIPASRLKEEILRLHPTFSERNLGFSKFAAFLDAMEKKGHLHLETTPNGLMVQSRAPAGAGNVSRKPVEADSVAEQKLLAGIRRRGGQFISGELHLRTWQLVMNKLDAERSLPRSELAEYALQALSSEEFADLTKSKVVGMLSMWSHAQALPYREGTYYSIDMTEIEAVGRHNQYILQIGADEGLSASVVENSSVYLWVEMEEEDDW